MKKIYIIGFLFLFASASFAHEETVLARVTGYWGTGDGASGKYAASNSARLRVGHCAVDPKRIPYGSKVIFPDATCVAVDTGPAVVSRKSARFCGHTAAQRNAIVIDRFFETKRDAVAWSNAHPQFMTLRIVPPGSHPERAGSLPIATKSAPRKHSPPSLCAINDEHNDRDVGPVARRVFNWIQL